VHSADALILTLIRTARQATDEEVQWLVSHVAQAPFSDRLLKINRWLHKELEAHEVQLALGKLPSVEIHLLKRMYLDQQWPPRATVDQFIVDLHQAVRHPDVRIWTYRWLSEAFAGFLAPSHVQNVLNPEAFIFVAYNASHSVIQTGFQASSLEAIFTDTVEHRIRHK
jgi:hypothetical protein